LRERGLERSYTIGYWAWELAKFPQEWTSSFAFVDEVWVASRFAYDAIAPATAKPVLLMPMAVALPPAELGLERADFGLPDDKFVFYFSFDFRSYAARKNPLATIEAFRRALPRYDAPAVLLLKTIGSDWKPDDRDNLVQAIGGDRRILLIDGEFTRRRAIALLALSDLLSVTAPLRRLRPRSGRGDAARQTSDHDRLLRHGRFRDAGDGAPRRLPASAGGGGGLPRSERPSLGRARHRTSRRGDTQHRR
jgi:hypothetical protein